jgi:hypothetical protein
MRSWWGTLATLGDGDDIFATENTHAKETHELRVKQTVRGDGETWAKNETYYVNAVSNDKCNYQEHAWSHDRNSDNNLINILKSQN